MTPDELREVARLLSLDAGDADPDVVAIRAAADAWEADRADGALEKRDKLAHAEKLADLREQLASSEQARQRAERERATLDAALTVFEANWNLGGHMEPEKFWNDCWPSVYDLVSREHQSFVWAAKPPCQHANHETVWHCLDCGEYV